MSPRRGSGLSAAGGGPGALPFEASFVGEAARTVETEREAVRTVVAITGASSGVGRATAHAYAKRGAKIGLIARGVEALEATAKEVEALGGQALVIPADVTEPERLEQAARQLERSFGPIEVWINDAAASVFSPISRTTPEELRRVMEVSYLGAAHGTQTALRRMRARDHGTIVNLGSAEVFHGLPRSGAESAAKHALHGFVESLRSELMHEGSAVQVTMVHLPSVNTPRLAMARSRLRHRPRPLGAVYEPEVAAEAILEAVAQQRRELFVGPRPLLTSLATRLAPALVERLYARSTYDALESTEPEGRGRPDNLDAPLEGDHGLRGDWAGPTRRSSVQLFLSTHRGALAVAAAVLAFVIALLSR